MTSSQMFSVAPEAVIIDDPNDVDSFLEASIGLSPSVLNSAIDIGAAEAALVTDNAPAASYGWMMYDRVVTSLRDQLVPSGWERARPGGLEAVMRKDKLLQITTSLGTEGTGLRPPASPTCKHDRGAATVVAVDANQTSLADLAPRDAAWRQIQTWWLLYYFAERGGQQLVRSELSLPLHIHNGRITQWGYRVLLGERPIGTTGTTIPESAPEPTIPELRRRIEA